MNLSTRWKWEEHRISPIVECAPDEGARFLKWEALISEALHSIADCHPPVYPPGKQEDETAKGKKCTKTTIDPQNREEITHEYSPSRVKDQLPLISTSEKKHACKYFGLPFDSAKSWPEPRRGDDHERGPKGRVEWWAGRDSNPRRRSHLIYSQARLTTSVPTHMIILSQIQELHSDEDILSYVQIHQLIN